MPSTLRAPAPSDFIEGLIALNLSMGEQMQDMLLSYLDYIQGKQDDAKRYDTFDWYRRLVHKEGANEAWFAVIYADIKNLAGDLSKPILLTIMSPSLIDQIRRYPLPDEELRP